MSDLLKDNAHIPTSEVKQDIADTEAEIVTLEREIKGLEILGDKMSMFRATGKKSGIKERQKFISKLKELLKARGK